MLLLLTFLINKVEYIYQEVSSWEKESESIAKLAMAG